MALEAAPKTRLILVCLGILGLFLANCDVGSQVPRPTSEAQPSSARSADNPLAYLRSVDLAASNHFFETNRNLFEYDREIPLDIQEVSRRIEDDLSIIEITYASPKGGRVPATLMVPQGTGPFAGIVMQRSMELEYGMRFAHFGAVVMYIDAPSFRPQNAGPRGILTFTGQDRHEQIQLIIDLRRAIDLLMARPDIDPERIAYLGVSYGGAMGGLLAGIEKRVKAYVLVVGDGGLVTHATNPENLTMTLNEFYEEYGAWIDDMWPIEPIHYVSHASPAPILFQNAVRDQYTNVGDALRYQDTASEPKQVIWYDAEHWPLPDEAIMDSAKWLQQFIGPGALYLLPAPNYRPSAVMIDRLLMIWLSLTVICLVFLMWDLSRQDGVFLRRNVKWFLLVALMGVIGLAVYFVSQRSDRWMPRPQ
ncbi:MAG: prolyl oligopeptidase family serine peptidase [Anaerolineales bacterium]